MACKYTFNRKKISVKSLIKTVHVPFSDILVLVMCDYTAAVVKMLLEKSFVCVTMHVGPITFIGRKFFFPALCILHA